MSTCGAAGASCASARVDVASSLRGASASSSAYSTSYPASGAINGDRRGLNWGSGGGWNDASPSSFPDWLEVDFYLGEERTVSEIDIFSLQDACGGNPNAFDCVEPTDTMTFSKYGLTSLQVQYWDGTAFVDAPNGVITGNNKVKRKLSPPVSTSKIRVWVNGAQNGYSRIVEFEAWEDQSALDADYERAIDNRIAMTGRTGCGASFSSTSIRGLNRKGAATTSLDSADYGIGSSQYSGFDSP